MLKIGQRVLVLVGWNPYKTQIGIVTGKTGYWWKVKTPTQEITIAECDISLIVKEVLPAKLGTKEERHLVAVAQAFLRKEMQCVFYEVDVSGLRHLIKILKEELTQCN